MSAEQQALVKKIFDSSTSRNDLKWDDSFRTQEFLQETISNKSKITSPEVASKVGWFFMKLALTDEGTKMATTREVYDVIINHCAKHATTAESVQWAASPSETSAPTTPMDSASSRHLRPSQP